MITSTNHNIDLDKITDDSVVVDGGACKGDFIRDIRPYFKGKIVAIEPNPAVIELIPKDVEIINKALVGKDMPKVMRLTTYPQPERNNLFELYPSETGYVDVETLTLNDLNLDKIDFLKLDIEGAEKNIFETITPEEASKIGQISMEVHSNVDLEWLKERLKELGFTISYSLPHAELYATR